MPSGEIIKEINTKADLTSLVSRYLPLQESRRALKGNCPFHEDDNLSFKLLPAKNSFKCFGCGAEGGPVDFLAIIEKRTFDEAAVILAKHLGLAERLSA